MTLTDVRRVHFVGIGGAGMSAVAKLLVERGLDVSGSDLKASPATRLLEAMGAAVHVGHDPRLVEGVELVVVSSAIPPTNAELERARALGVRVISRGEALAAVLEGRKAIVVAGTHGKTTTTSMIVAVLQAAGIDAPYLVGSGLNDAATNARDGRGELAVAESDESDGSFLLLTPHIAVVTNVEIDHVDYWHSASELMQGFAMFMDRTATDGSIVVPSAQPDVVAAAHASGRRTITFGEDADVSAADVVLEPDGTRLTIRSGTESAFVALHVPGLHNVANALAAAAASLEAGIGLERIARGLSEFHGVDRRWQIKGTARGVTVIDDYAHHPTEVRATLAAARPGPWSRVVAVFQPHRYTRTAAFAREFGRAFDNADRIVVTDVYGAGEEPVPGVTGKLVADAVSAHLPGRPVAYLPHRAELLAYLESGARPGDALLTLGAGDVTSVGEELLERLGGAA